MKYSKRQNDDEQLLYVASEENITDLRLRLEQVTAARVTLIVPAQTQLRGQVAWKLLHKKARELGLDICVVSNDLYVRTMAQLAHLRVLTSLTQPKAS